MKEYKIQLVVDEPYVSDALRELLDITRLLHMNLNGMYISDNEEQSKIELELSTTHSTAIRNLLYKIYDLKGYRDGTLRTSETSY